jgi:hypothetical protein
MSMSANFHNVKRVELETLHVQSAGRSHPMLSLYDDAGCYIAAHLTAEGVDQLEAAVAAYRALNPVLAEAA